MVYIKPVPVYRHPSLLPPPIQTTRLQRTLKRIFPPPAPDRDKVRIMLRDDLKAQYMTYTLSPQRSPLLGQAKFHPSPPTQQDQFRIGRAPAELMREEKFITTKTTGGRTVYTSPSLYVKDISPHHRVIPVAMWHIPPGSTFQQAKQNPANCAFVWYGKLHPQALKQKDGKPTELFARSIKDHSIIPNSQKWEDLPL